MESQKLHLSVDYVGTSGMVLSPEEKASLQNSLTILQNNQKFARVYFWGKILGIKDHYYIAQGVSSDEFLERKVLYSKDCVHWGLLPPPTEEMKVKAHLAKGRFTGDPSYEIEHVEMKKVGDGEEAEEEETIMIKEEERLSAVIAEIDSDVRIVPRGSYVRSPTGQVYKNRSFEGLNVAESAKLCNYMHFRDAIKLYGKSLLAKANLDPAIDFMDPIDEDIPKGSWSLQFERGSALVSLRSLLWQGYVFYQIPGTCEFGSVYFGTGEKNMDLPFML